MKKIAVIAVAGALALGGCVSNFGTSSDVTKQGEINTITVQYKGKPLTCIQMWPDTNAQTLSCDFIKYYATKD